MARENHTTTSPFVALEAKWLAVSASAERASERIDQRIEAMPEALRENWTRQPQYVDCGIQAAEIEAEAAVDRVIADNPAEAEDFRGGNDKVMGWFVGQVMKATGGKANPKSVNQLLRKKLTV